MSSHRVEQPEKEARERKRRHDVSSTIDIIGSLVCLKWLDANFGLNVPYKYTYTCTIGVTSINISIYGEEECCT